VSAYERVVVFVHGARWIRPRDRLLEEAGIEVRYLGKTAGDFDYRIVPKITWCSQRLPARIFVPQPILHVLRLLRLPFILLRRRGFTVAYRSTIWRNAKLNPGRAGFSVMHSTWSRPCSVGEEVALSLERAFMGFQLRLPRESRTVIPMDCYACPQTPPEENGGTEGFGARCSVCLRGTHCSTEEPRAAPESFRPRSRSDPNAHLVWLERSLCGNNWSSKLKIWRSRPSPLPGCGPIFRTCWARWMFSC